MMDEAKKKELRQAVFPMVKDLMLALTANGMTPEEAAKSVRWATHRLENANEVPEGAEAP